MNLEGGVCEKCEVAESFLACGGFGGLFGDELHQIVQKFIGPLRTENIIADIFPFLLPKPSFVLLELTELIDEILDDILHQ